MKKATIALLLVCVAGFAQQKGTFTDTRDGKTYKTVKIGTQTWMAENLNYAAEGSKCNDNDPANCEKYGRLYDVGTARNNAKPSNAVPSGVQGVCPAGWHLPSLAEWLVMTDYIGGDGTREKFGRNNTRGKKLKATSGWSSVGKRNDGNGTDEYGFSALPGGSGIRGGFTEVGDEGFWWSASEVYSLHMNSGKYHNKDEASWFNFNAGLSYSVRCVQDKEQNTAASLGSGEQQEAMQEYQKAVQEYKEAMQKNPAAQQEAAQKYQGALKKYQETVQKAQQEAMQKIQQEAMQKMPVAQQEYQKALQEAGQKYREAVQKNPAAQQEALQEYQKAQQEAGQKYQKAQQ